MFVLSTRQTPAKIERWRFVIRNPAGVGRPIVAMRQHGWLVLRGFLLGLVVITFVFGKPKEGPLKKKNPNPGRGRDNPSEKLISPTSRSEDFGTLKSG